MPNESFGVSHQQILQNIGEIGFKRLDKGFERLDTAVIGDEAAGHRGLAKRMEANEKKTDDALTQIKAFKVVGSTLGVIWGAIITLIAIFKHKIV